MTAPLVDTHAHLDGSEYAGELEQVVARARDAGVHSIVTVGQDEASSGATMDLVTRFPGLFAAVGVHPHLAKDAGDMRWLPPLLAESRIIAAGEMGLDYHYDFSPRDRQREVFARQLEWAGRQGLPAIVHCREAYDDVIAILAQHRASGVPAVVHCFTATFEVGKELIDRCDVFLGIGGAVTFKNATDLQDAVSRLPLERMVLETDCPYMTPAPHRGRRNEPAYLRLTCDKVAALRGTTSEAIAEATTANALRLFPRLSITS